LETQATNVPAIRFYMALGFAVVGLDLSLYGNDDAARGEVALFMARAVEARTDLSARSTRAP
jgi:ribosomal protein S18 acetylase RimI-like enzyme